MSHNDQDVTAAALARIEAAKGRADAASVGPWIEVGDDLRWNVQSTSGKAGVRYVAQACNSLPSGDGADAAFIAHARADVPLLAAIATAAVRLGPRWWVFSDGYGRTRCTQCYAWTEGDSSDLVHAPDCRAMQLDSAIRAAGETGQ